MDGNPKGAGRPSLYSEELADRIADLLMECKSMRAISRMEGMPNQVTMLRWMASKPEFAAKCAHARQIQAEVMVDRIVELGDECDEDNYQSTRVKLAAYQWGAMKLAPKKYGDKIEHTGEVGIKRILVPDRVATKPSEKDITPEF